VDGDECCTGGTESGEGMMLVYTFVESAMLKRHVFQLHKISTMGYCFLQRR
jgi:hypothetical protein